LKQSEKVLAAVTGVVVSTVVVWSFVVQPTIRSWRDVAEKDDTVRDKLARWKELLGRESRLRADRDAIEVALTPPDDGGAGSSAPGAAEAGFLEHLRGLTDAAGLKPKDLSYVQTHAFDAYAELRFALKARAPLKPIQDFLVRMAASPWYLRVESLTISPRDGGEVEADMSLIALANKDALEPEERKTK
jgi:hypothetical protein